MKRIAHTTPWVATGDQAMPSVTLLRRQGEAGGEERMVSVISDLVHTMTDQTNLTLDRDDARVILFSPSTPPPTPSASRAWRAAASWSAAKLSSSLPADGGPLACRLMFSVAFYLPVRSGGQLPTALCRPRQRRPPEQIACRDEAAPQGRSPLLSTTSASLATRPTLSRPPWADWSMDASVPNPSFSRPTVQSPTGPPSAGRPGLFPDPVKSQRHQKTALARLAHTSHQIVIKGQSYRKKLQVTSDED